MRNLEAMMIAAHQDKMYIISGNGDVIEPDGDVLEIGSGGEYAKAAAIAMLENTTLSAT